MMTRFGCAAAMMLLGAGGAMAAPVNLTGLVTPDVIFGDGNDNGAFTGETANNIEVGLRGKLRYDEDGAPQNTFNYDGDRTYTFDPTGLAVPTNRSVFNFEFSVNVDAGGTSGAVLAGFEYLLSVDSDPSAGTNFLSFDPTLFLIDSATGDNTTGNGDGADDTSTFLARLFTDNVLQNSQNLGFGYAADPDALGIYTIELSVFEFGSDLSLASSSIDVIVGPEVAPVPLPAAFPVLGGALLLLGAATRRRKTAST